MLSQEGTISEDDVKLYTITDSVDEMIDMIKSNRTYCKHDT